jgi:SAM-dependent methyltransferase
MTTDPLPSTAGYGENATALAEQYESIAFEQVHRDILPLLPAPPACALDIGAGTGRDAAALVRRGYRVVAVEPTSELRTLGQSLHAEVAIDWVDDALPELASIHARHERFDVVLLTAVWMHLDAAERERAMPSVRALVAPGGLVALSLRHGPVPPGRRMFAVTAAETIGLAATVGLILLARSERSDRLDRSGVSWSYLAFRRPAKPPG